MSEQTYDVAVLGGGPGGYAAALRVALRDPAAKVCCIEEKNVGGTCLNVGCIPTKAMLRASELLYSMTEMKTFGLYADGARVDGDAFMLRVTRTVGALRKGVESLLKARKVEIIRGRGKLTAPGTIEVSAEGGAKTIQAKNIILATGSRAVKPGFLPWDSDRVWTTDEATTTATLPQSVLIIGGGVIGCEFATAYSELGIATTVVEMLDSLAPGLEIEASKTIARSLKKRKVKVLTGSRVTSVLPGADSVVTELADGQRFETDRVLVSVGRLPNIQDIGLEELGVKVEGGVVVVDERCRTSVEGIYAIGDIAETRQYAHLATRMGIVAADNITGHDVCDDRTVVPAGIYTHPQVAAVGLSEEKAVEKHGADAVKSAVFNLRASGLAQAYGIPEGQVKIVGEKATGKVLGATIVSAHATDLIQELALAMKHGLTVEEVAETIHPHPTLVETLGETADVWLGLPLHSM